MRLWNLFIAMGLACVSVQSQEVRVDSRQAGDGVRLAAMDRQALASGDAFALQLRLGPMLEREDEAGASRTLAARVGAALEQTGLAQGCLINMHLDRLEWVCGVEVETAEGFGDLADAARCVIEFDHACWDIDADGIVVGTPDGGRLDRLDVVSSQLVGTGRLRAAVEQLRDNSKAHDDLAQSFLQRVGYHDRLAMCAVVSQGDPAAIVQAMSSVFLTSQTEDVMENILLDEFAEEQAQEEDRFAPAGLAVLEREGLPVDAVELIFSIDHAEDDSVWVLSNMAAGLARERLIQSDVRTIVDPVANVADVPGFGTLATFTMIVPSGQGEKAITQAQTVISGLGEHAVSEEELDAVRAHTLSPLVERVERNPGLDSRHIAMHLARELGAGREVASPMEMFHAMNIQALDVDAEVLAREAHAMFAGQTGLAVLMTASRSEPGPQEALADRQQTQSQQQSFEQAERTERLRLAFRMEARLEIRQTEIQVQEESQRVAQSSVVSHTLPIIVEERVDQDEKEAVEVTAVRILEDGAIEAETSIGITIKVSLLLPLAEGLVHVGLVVDADAVENARVVERDEVIETLRDLVDDAGEDFRDGAHIELRSASVELDLVELAIEALSGD